MSLSLMLNSSENISPLMRFIHFERLKLILLLFVFSPLTIHVTAQELEWELVNGSAAFGPRDGAGLFVYKNKMWLVGGWHSDSVPTTCSEVWNSTDGIDWNCVTPHAPWPGRHAMGTVVYNDKMWIISGDGNADVWNSEDGYNWTMVADSAPWGKRYKPYILVFHDTIWLMGGFDYFNGNYVVYNDVWYSTDGENWILGTSDAGWGPRGIIHGQVIMDDKIWIVSGGLYVLNGYYSEVYYNDVWNSSDGIHWTQVTSGAPWVPRIHHSTEVFDGKIWMMAGHNKRFAAGPHRLRKDVWFSYDGINWTELENTPWDYTHAASICVFNNSLWLVAGFLRNEVWRLKYSLGNPDSANESDFFQIYPNPASEYVNIVFSGKSEDEASYNFKIFNSIGKLIYQQDISFNEHNRTTINTSNFSSGMYYIKISGNYTMQVLNLLIQK